MWFLIVTLFPNVGPLGIFFGHLFSIMLYTFLFLKYEVRFPAYLKYLMLGSVLFSITIFCSLLANYDQTGISLSQIRYALVPIYWIMGLLAGVVDAKIFRTEKRPIFFYLAAFFIVFQIPVILSQALGIDSILWISEKARDWTRFLRVVGTVQNPNALGIISVFCVAIFGKNLKQFPILSKILIIISFLIILATGSRTSLIVLLLLPVLFIPREKIFSKSTLHVAAFISVVLLVVYFILSALREALPYMSQVLNLVEGGTVNTLNTRLAHWEEVQGLYYSSSFKNVLFGFGPGYFNVLDNSYFYVLFNYGIFSCLLFVILVYQLFKTSNLKSSKTAQVNLLVLLICGVVADVLLSFLFMTVIYYFIGLEYVQTQERGDRHNNSP